MSDTNTSDNEWKQRELGALWRRSGKSQKYLSGYIKLGDELEEREVRLIVFTNKYKSENEKAPDFVIYESTPMEQSSKNETSASSQSSSSTKSEPVEEDEELAELLK
jgi:hypothetical protein